jgi:hypothetical protein
VNPYRADPMHVAALQAENEDLRRCVAARDEALAAWEFWRESIERSEVALSDAQDRICSLEGEVYRLSYDRDQIAATVQPWMEAVHERDRAIVAMTERIAELSPKPGMLRRFWAWARRPM